MAKNIVICCDGTGNQVEGNLSNVLKLFQIVIRDDTQRVCYQPGIGTIGTDDAWTRLKQNTKAVFELATGYGLDDEILGAYKFLVEQYEDGDDIYLFGFSRGSYTVRALAGLIDAKGLLDATKLEQEIATRDQAIVRTATEDAQIQAIRTARGYVGDRLIRVAQPHRLLDPAAGPLIAVRLHILTRKTLGGLQTDLSARVLGSDGSPLPGVYAAGEVAGFGGGGMHGYRSLEGTFLGGCLFSGRTAGRAAAASVV